MNYSDLAAGKETIPHKRYLSPEEKELLRIENTDKMIELESHQQELKDLKAIKAPLVKQLKKDIGKKLSLLKNGFEFANRECYLVPNHDTGKMEYVDCETSEILFERKLTPAEKQLRITDLKIA